MVESNWQELGGQALGSFERGEKITAVVEKKDETTLEELKENLKVAKETWLNKKAIIEASRKLFDHILRNNEVDLEQVEKELSDLEKIYNDIKKQYEEAGGVDQDEAVEFAGVDTKIAQTEESIPPVEQLGSSVEVGDYEKVIDQIRVEFEEIDNERMNIYAKYPDLRSIRDVDAELASIEDVAMDVLNEEKAKALSTLRDLRDSFKDLYMKTWTSILDMGVGVDQSILEIPAREYISEHDQADVVKKLETLKSKMTPEQIGSISLEPEEGENVAQWTRRMTNFILIKL